MAWSFYQLKLFSLSKCDRNNSSPLKLVMILERLFLSRKLDYWDKILSWTIYQKQLKQIIFLEGIILKSIHRLFTLNTSNFQAFLQDASQFNSLKRNILKRYFYSKGLTKCLHRWQNMYQINLGFCPLSPLYLLPDYHSKHRLIFLYCGGKTNFQLGLFCPLFSFYLSLSLSSRGPLQIKKKNAPRLF